MAKRIIKFSPGRVILGALLVAIIGGTLLLSLPIARLKPIPFIDIIFTAASLTCVTGLLTVPLSSFSSFGHVIILMLMQIGGLGLITLTLFLISIFFDLGLSTQLLLGEMLELESWKNVRRFLYFILKVTVVCELIGTFLVFFLIRSDYSFYRACFLSLFHAISSFCDAGFSLFPNGMITYAQNWPMLGITSLLMLCGGIGFLTWFEFIRYLRSLKHKKKPIISLSTKITLSLTGIIVGFSSMLFWLLERHNSFLHLNIIDSLLHSIFSGISYRSTGFTLVPIAELHIASIFVIMIIAFIGSAPGSTGSGIKLTAFALLLATVRAAMMGRSSIHIKGRRIPRSQLYKALAIVALSVSWIIIAIFFLLITERGWNFIDIVFEVFSALATLGLSTGITPYLTLIGKLIIIITMILGRIGPLTVIFALRKRKHEGAAFEYPEERIMLG